MSLDLSTLTGADFPAYGEADWRDAVTKVLKGGSFETLRTPTLDGLTIEPIYGRVAMKTAIPTQRGASPWIVSQRVDHPDATEANALALADLGGGAAGLDLVFSSSPHARGFGLCAETAGEIASLLADVIFDIISMRVDGGDDTLRLTSLILDHVFGEGGSAEGSPLSLTMVCDPIGAAAAGGGSKRPIGELVGDVCGAAAALASRGTGGTLLNADGRIYHNAGASRVETLAAVLATAVAYWRGLEAAGLSVDEAAAKIGFSLAIDQNQFSSIAEIRALRLLWARATSAAGIPPATARIHAETSFRMMSELDANTNLIRTTIAAFAAGVGGADGLTVLPFSAANGLPDAFARRLARNTQLILLEESNIFRVKDPTAGSGRVETETRDLASAAWALFREIEAGGGIIAALKAGTLQVRIAATSAARRRDIARRKQPLTGVSEYPILTLPEVTVLDIAPRTPPSPSPSLALVETCPALESHRLSEPFEHLRDTAVTAALKVFLAPLGTMADFGVRAAWVKTLFEVGGIAVVANDGYKSLDDLVAAFKSSGAEGVCIASSDAVYAQQALPAVAALKAIDAGPVFFAGKPTEELQEDSLRAAGVDAFLFAGQDMIVALTDAQARLFSSRAGH